MFLTRIVTVLYVLLSPLPLQALEAASEAKQQSLLPDNLDLSIDAVGRTYPLGGGLSATAGYGALVWGADQQAEPGGMRYGFLRPSVTLTTSGYFNAVAAELELFPVSFAGLRIGKEYYTNYDDYEDYDCTVYECQGKFDSVYLEADMALKYRQFIYLGKASKARLDRRSSTDRFFMEPVSGLPADPTGDRLVEYVNTFAYSFNERWMLALQDQRWKMKKSETRSKSLALNLVRTAKRWNATVGLGRYDSDILDDDVMAIIKLEYIVLPKKYNKF